MTMQPVNTCPVCAELKAECQTCQNWRVNIEIERRRMGWEADKGTWNTSLGEADRRALASYERWRESV